MEKITSIRTSQVNCFLISLSPSLSGKSPLKHHKVSGCAPAIGLCFVTHSIFNSFLKTHQRIWITAHECPQSQSVELEPLLNCVRGGGASCQGRRGEDILLRKYNLRFIETKATRRGSSTLCEEKNKSHFGKNCLRDRYHETVSEIAQLWENLQHLFQL